MNIYKLLVFILFLQFNVNTSEKVTHQLISQDQLNAQGNILKQSVKYIYNLISTKKTFGFLIIALLVYKRNKIKLWLMALKHYMIVKKLEYCAITLTGKKLKNIVIHNNYQYQNNNPNLLFLPGPTYMLNLSDLEHYSSESFDTLIKEQNSQGLEFILARVITNNSSWAYRPERFIYDCNAATFHKNFFEMYKNNLLMISFYFPYNATFFNEHYQPLIIEEVCYFQILDQHCKYLGSSKDLDSKSIKQKEMSWSFIKAMNDQEIRNWLLTIEDYYQKTENLVFNNRVFEYLLYIRQKRDHEVFATYLTAFLYFKKKKFAQAVEIINLPMMQNQTGEIEYKILNLKEQLENFY